MFLKVNVWISFIGLKKNDKLPSVFPYKAFSPVRRVRTFFNSIEDVHRELLTLYIEAEEKNYDMGQAVYEQSLYFCNQELLIDKDIQQRIKEFQFCKTFNCNPYPSLQDTPAMIVDDFFIIEEEHKKCIRYKQEENNA